MCELLCLMLRRIFRRMSYIDLCALGGRRNVWSPMSAGIGFMCAVFSLSLALPPSLPDQGGKSQFEPKSGKM